MRYLILVSTLLLLASEVSLAGHPVTDLTDVAVPIRSDGSRFTTDEIRSAIIKGSQSRLWTAEVVGDRLVRAKLNVKNKHYAVVEIPFTETSFSILYVSSENLDYNSKKHQIHRNYNKWVVQLSAQIDKAFQDIEREAAVVRRDRARVSGLFDELMKLDELRDQGLLTDEEFEAEKKKLLDGR